MKDREIKFRAYDKEHKIMFKDNLTVLATLRSKCLCEENRDLEVYEHFQFMQYIGTKDITGKEVYDGDLLQDEQGKIYKISWGYDLLWLAVTKETHSNCYCPGGICKRAKVIGNIYENPELYR